MEFLRYHSGRHGVVLVLRGIMHVSEVSVQTEEALAGLLLHIINQVYCNILQVRHVAWGGPCMVALTFNDRHSTVVLGVSKGTVLLVGSTGIDSGGAPVEGSAQTWWWLLLTTQTTCIIFKSW